MFGTLPGKEGFLEEPLKGAEDKEAQRQGRDQVHFEEESFCMVQGQGHIQESELLRRGKGERHRFWSPFHLEVLFITSTSYVL